MPKSSLLAGAAIRSFRAASRVHGRYFSAGIAPLSAARPKFAFIVSKKVAVKATTRNLLKRRAKSLAVRALPHLPPRAIVLFAKRGAAEAPFAALAADLEAIFEQVAAA